MRNTTRVALWNVIEPWIMPTSPSSTLTAEPAQIAVLLPGTSASVPKRTRGVRVSVRGERETREAALGRGVLDLGALGDCAVNEPQSGHGVLSSGRAAV
jgi:hypothetical protein